MAKKNKVLKEVLGFKLSKGTRKDMKKLLKMLGSPDTRTFAISAAAASPPSSPSVSPSTRSTSTARKAARAWRTRRSSVDHFAVDFAGAVLDEVEAVLGVAAHQLVDELRTA